MKLSFHFPLLGLLSTLWIYHFHQYSMSFLPLYTSFHLDSLYCQPDSPYFAHFHPDFPNSYTDSPHPHSHLILRIPTLKSPHFPHSVPQFPILTFIDSLLNLQSLRIYFREIVNLVQMRTLPFVTTAWRSAPNYCLHLYDVISVIIKNYLLYSVSSKILIICEVWANNFEWPKCYLRFMSKGSTICPKLSIFSSFVPVYIKEASSWKLSTIFAKRYILDVWQGFEYTCVIRNKR